jgi:hypothetical protein
MGPTASDRGASGALAASYSCFVLCLSLRGRGAKHGHTFISHPILACWPMAHPANCVHNIPLTTARTLPIPRER